MLAEIVFSGQCPNCSTKANAVLHGVPWCPLLPAVARVDTNGIDRVGDVDRVSALASHVSRPVTMDELVLLVDTNDGPDAPFATWGRAVMAGGDLIVFDLVGRNGRGRGWTYA